LPCLAGALSSSLTSPFRRDKPSFVQDTLALRVSRFNAPCTRRGVATLAGTIPASRRASQKKHWRLLARLIYRGIRRV